MADKIKVFISSTMTDLQAERDAVQNAIDELHLEAVRAETRPSTRYPPRHEVLAMVRDCDIYLGIFGARYGWMPPGENISVTEMEFREACNQGKHILVYVKDVAEREPAQTEFVERVEDFDTGRFRRPRFTSSEQLVEWVKEDIPSCLSGIIIRPTRRPSLMEILLLITALALVSCLIGGFFFWKGIEEHRRCLRRVFPSAPSGLQIVSYGTNGRARGDAICDKPLDGRNAYLQVNLQAYDPSVKSNSGVILVLQGFDARKFQALSFWARGEHSGERFGVKMKNDIGQEVLVWVTDYLSDREIDTRWKEVVIPLAAFRGVPHLPLESITIFSAGDVAGVEPQQFYVAQIRFY